MAGASGAVDTGGGGLDAGSSAASTSGDIGGSEKAYGGINIESGFKLDTNTVLMIAAGVAVFFYARKQKWI